MPTHTTNDAMALLDIPAWALAHVEARVRRLNHAIDWIIHAPARSERENGGSGCPLCGHSLGPPEQRAPRDERNEHGEWRRLPAELLVWRRCGGCGLYQRGEPERDERGMP